MDGPRFDRWTRRRFGLTAGSAAAALLAPNAFRIAEAKKKTCKKNEKRCGKMCVKGTCCPGKTCLQNCICERTVEGKSFCGAAVPVLVEPCPSSSVCEPGWKCIKLSGSDRSTTCAPPCGYTPEP
jgi:hypothetical protein